MDRDDAVWTVDTITRCREALRRARAQLVTLGGDRPNCDEIQRAVLKQIDDALHN